MNKNVKKIIAMALVIGAFSGVAPATSANFLTTKAYASDNDEDKLESLELTDSDGSNIKLYEDNDYEDKVKKDDVDDDVTYYAKTSSDTINIDIDGPSTKYVRVFKGTSSSTKGKKVSSDITLDKDSTTTLTIRVYDEEPDSDIRYDDDDYLSQYKVKVKYTGDKDSSDSSDSDDSDSSDDYDDIYLDKLSVDGKSIDLSKSKVKYTYDVDSGVDEVTVRATPEDTDYDVSIDNDDVDEDDKFKSDVKLDKGENEIKIKIEDDDNNEREYTLIINRGGTSSTKEDSSTTKTADSKPSTADEIVTVRNQWLQVSGQWQYKDATGNSVKNTWMGNYFLKSDGNMATGWQNINEYKYYFGTDGAKTIAWKYIDGKWYHFDSQGKMQTGWIRDINDGKYYYLNTDGTMASNTSIGAYKLGADGAWIQK